MARATITIAVAALSASAPGCAGDVDGPGRADAPGLPSETAQCPPTGDPRYLAEVAEKRAELRLQAAAFRPEAHLAALPLLAEAAACLRDAGDEAGRQRLERAHHIERARVETRYRLLQLRLERALSTGDRRLAATTARALRALVGEGSPKYAARLAHIAQMEFE